MSPLILYGAIGALGAGLLTATYLKGRSDCAAAHALAEVERAAEEVEEKAADDAAQAKSAAGDAEALKIDNARLRRIIAGLNANDKATSQCGMPGESDGVHDAHAEIFETGLPAGGRLDGGE